MNRQAAKITAIADVALPASRGVLQRKCACGTHTPGGGECETCSKHGRSLQREASHSSSPATHPSSVPPIVHDVLRRPGAPLDAATRSFMEPRFAHDFSQVRIHTGGQAAESARALSAHAYTAGRNISRRKTIRWRSAALFRHT